MALLNSKFDTPRGYPNGSALAEPFKIKKTGAPLAPVSLPQGTLITQELQNNETVMDAATSPDLTAADPIDVWVVVEGNDDYSGEYVEKVMACKCLSGLIWETDQLTVGAYPPGTALSFSAGKLKPKTLVTEQIVGHVLHDYTSTKGTIWVSS
jgi:hypothetical protein